MRRTLLLTNSLACAQGIALLKQAIEIMAEDIRANKGDLQVKVQPRAVDERDDKLLGDLMTKLEAQNEEVDGDSDAEENDEGMGSADIS